MGYSFDLSEVGFLGSPAGQEAVAELSERELTAASRFSDVAVARKLVGERFAAAVLETAVRAIRPEWQPWLLTNNATALVLPDGLTLYTGYDQVTGQSTEYLLGNLQAGVFMTVVTAVVLGIGIVLFSRRDLH